MRRRAWIFGCELTLLLLIPVLAAGGCGKPVFTVLERKICKGVDGAGNPVDETSRFAPEDGRVFVWFRYKNASPGQVIKVNFTYTDELGNESTEEIETELKPGSKTGAAELAGEEGDPLARGRYTAEVRNEAGTAYGPALVFTVE